MRFNGGSLRQGHKMTNMKTRALVSGSRLTVMWLCLPETPSCTNLGLSAARSDAPQLLW